jgi:hypothetical protein
MEPETKSQEDPLIDKPLTKPNSTARRIKKYICMCIPVYEDDTTPTQPQSQSQPIRYKIQDYESEKVYLVGSDAERTFVLFTRVDLEYTPKLQPRECP